MTQKILFTGSRKASQDMLDATKRYILEHLVGKDACVIVGDAEGIDYQVIQICDELEIPIEVHGANGEMRHKTWTGKNIIHLCSYLERNRIMAEKLGHGDTCVAVWSGDWNGGIIGRSGTVTTARYALKSCGNVQWIWKKP